MLDTSKLMPFSIEAEQSVIGGLLLDNRAWDAVSETLRAEDFYRDDHRRIFRHMQAILERGQPADVLTVAESIEESGESAQTGGLAYLGDIAYETPSAANVRRYGEIVRERAKLRRVMSALSDGITACCSPSGTSAEAISNSVESALAAIQATDAGGDVASWVAVAGETLAWLSERAEKPGGIIGLTTGLSTLDRMLNGLNPGQLMILAARPSVGKTALGLNILEHVTRLGNSALMFSLEMPRREIGARLLALETGTAIHNMLSGEASELQWNRLAVALGKAGERRLSIDDRASITLSHIRAKARHVKRQAGGLDLILVDYLQLMNDPAHKSSRVQEVGAISRGLKALAKELECPIVALAQLNRATEGRTDRRPMLADLRDSGEIEQDADIVLMLHREGQHNNQPEWNGLAELLIRKNRNGATGEVLLEFDGPTCRFTESGCANPRSTPPPVGRRRGFQDSPF